MNLIKRMFMFIRLFRDGVFACVKWHLKRIFIKHKSRTKAIFFCIGKTWNGQFEIGIPLDVKKSSIKCLFKFSIEYFCHFKFRHYKKNHFRLGLTLHCFVILKRNNPGTKMFQVFADFHVHMHCFQFKYTS